MWNSLSDQEKTWVQQAADASSVYQRKLWAESEREALEAVEAAGVEIIHPDKSTFQSQVQELYEGYQSEPVMMDLINRVKNTEAK